MTASKQLSQSQFDEIQRERKVFLWNVIAGVAASTVFLVFIQPILTSLWDLISSMGGTLLGRFVDGIYEYAARDNRNFVPVLGALMVLYLPLILVFVTWPVVAVSQRLVGQDTEQSSKLKSRRSLAVKLALAFLSVLVGTPAAVCIYTDFQLNTSFEQRVAVLSPHISDSQLKVLRANWAAMDSKDKYLAIKASMERAAIDAKIKLPPSLLGD